MIVVVSGTVENQADFCERFEHVVRLSAFPAKPWVFERPYLREVIGSGFQKLIARLLDVVALRSPGIRCQLLQRALLFFIESDRQCYEVPPTILGK